MTENQTPAPGTTPPLVTWRMQTQLRQDWCDQHDKPAIPFVLEWLEKAGLIVIERDRRELAIENLREMLGLNREAAIDAVNIIVDSIRPVP